MPECVVTTKSGGRVPVNEAHIVHAAHRCLRALSRYVIDFLVSIW